MPSAPDEKYRCVLGPLTLCVRYRSPKLLDLRVVHRSTTTPCALVVRPGTVLRLCRKKETIIVRARVFCPRIQYGRWVAGGELEIF
jgi:hypothetical protein